MRGDTAQLQALLDVEVALAEALAVEGVIPATAVPAIRGAARAELYDGAALSARAAQAGNLVIPLVEQLTARVASSDADAARYVHWGATSQDILDTALVLFGPELYDRVVRIYTHPLFRMAEVGLAAAVLYHALNGIRITILDFWPELSRKHRELFYAAVALFLLLFLPSAYLMLKPLF